MIQKALLERVIAKLPTQFTLGKLVDKVLELQAKENWVYYYNPIVMKDGYTSTFNRSQNEA